MESELACVVCNYAGGMWDWIAAGAAGAAAAVGGAVYGSYGAHDPYEDRWTDESGDDSSGGRVPPVEDRERAWRESQSWESGFSRWTWQAQKDLTHTIWGDPSYGEGPPGDQIIGTVAGTARDTGSMHYDADYDGRDYEQNPIEPPGPRP
jgi:hypothetical protein